MLADGDIDAVIGPRAPSCFGRHPHVGWLYPDPAAAAAAWFRKSRIFPIMHILGIRRTLAEQHPWLPVAAMQGVRAVEGARAREAGRRRGSKVTLPFLDEHLHAARRSDGRGLLAIRAGREPPCAGGVPATSSRRGPVVAGAVTRGVIPSLDARNASRLIASVTSAVCSVPNDAQSHACQSRHHFVAEERQLVEIVDERQRNPLRARRCKLRQFARD